MSRAVNAAGLKLIAEFEGCRLKSYKDIAGVWTVGYGLTSRAGFIEVNEDTSLTQDEADYWLEKVVADFAQRVENCIERPISDNAFAACVSLAYNIGSGAFAKSTALRRINEGDMAGAAEAFLMWNKSGGRVVEGLKRRRAAEKVLFETPDPVVETPDPAPVGRSSPAKSTTVQASVVQVATAVGGGLTAVSSLEGDTQTVALVVCGVIALAAMWILKERLRKWANGDH